jgi:hypothetical protein
VLHFSAPWRLSGKECIRTAGASAKSVLSFLFSIYSALISEAFDLRDLREPCIRTAGA